MNKLNPYRVAFSLAFNRLKWDLTPKSWSSRSKLRSLHNCYSGEKAVIVCNGPSLLKSDFKLLDKVYTFGLNKINLLFDKQSFRPSCIVSVNPFVIEQNKNFYAKTDIPLFLDAQSSQASGLIQEKHPCFLHSSDFPFFSGDCSLSVFQGYTVTYVAMQLAFHFGFSEVALVGCDHSYAAKGHANTVQTAESEDESHFHPAYFSGGDQWQLPDLRQSEVFYEKAFEYYEKAGRKLFNATVGGRLELLPRIELSEFLL